MIQNSPPKCYEQMAPFSKPSDFVSKGFYAVESQSYLCKFAEISSTSTVTSNYIFSSEYMQNHALCFYKYP